MSLRDAQRIALAHLNAPAPMDPALWADQMRALHGTLQRIQVRDESVASAARLASVIAGRHEPVEATAFREALRDVEVTEWAQAGQQARSVAAILTHAAAPAITNPARRTLVAGVEQRLLQPEGPAPARPLTDALTRWQDTVTLAAPACGHPMVGASIAFQQAQLVRLVERTLDRVEAPAGDVERLRASLAQTREAWIAARERLMTNSWQQPTEPRLYSASQSIGMASSELTRALSSQLPTSPSHTLSALLGTSIGGQDTAASMTGEAKSQFGRTKPTTGATLLEKPAHRNAFLRLQDLPHVTVLGEVTGGGIGIPCHIPLGNDLEAWFTSAVVYDRDGNSVDVHGIRPDAPLVVDPTEL